MKTNRQVPKYQIFNFAPKRTKYCIAIPIINEGEKFKKQLKSMKQYSKMADILIFDGGSKDGSTNPKFLKDNGVRTLIISPSGQSRQLRSGFDFSLKQGYQGVITIDGNNKDDPSAILNFIKALDQDYDFVQGSRFLKDGHHQSIPWDRLVIARLLISPVLSLSAHYWYTDTPNAFRAYSRRYLLHPKVQPFREVFKRYELLFYLTVRAHRLKLKTKEIPVSRGYPKGQVPTKIVGYQRIFDLLNILKIALGFFNPK